MYLKTKRKNRLFHKFALFVVIVLVMGLGLVILKRFGTNINQPMEIDPHLGMVQVFNGEDYVWIIPENNVPVNQLTADDFSINENGEPSYNGTAYASFRGIDISEHQGDIDWEKVKQSGIDFAIIRVGARGYSEEGKLITDAKFAQNFANARAAGLKLGVYFFSQAISVEEAREEAEFVLKLIDGAELELPVYFDWEHIVVGDDARTDGLPGNVATDCAIAFCDTVAAAGYKTGIYTNLDMSYYAYEMNRIADYGFWNAAVGEYPYSYYAFDIWQYSFDGNIPGIQYPCDMNMMLVKYG